MDTQRAATIKYSRGRASIRKGIVSVSGWVSFVKKLYDIQTISRDGIPILNQTGVICFLLFLNGSARSPNTASPVTKISAKLNGATVPLRLKAAIISGNPRLSSAIGNSEAVMVVLSEFIDLCVTSNLKGLEELKVKKIISVVLSI